jgi:hypothetical protein
MPWSRRNRTKNTNIVNLSMVLLSPMKVLPVTRKVPMSGALLRNEALLRRSRSPTKKVVGLLKGSGPRRRVKTSPAARAKDA